MHAWVSEPLSPVQGRRWPDTASSANGGQAACREDVRRGSSGASIRAGHLERSGSGQFSHCAAKARPYAYGCCLVKEPDEAAYTPRLGRRSEDLTRQR